MTTQVLTTEVPGNTTAGTSTARNFQITLNQIDKYNDIKDYLTNLKTFYYLISCKETAPTTGHEHIHIYTHFNKPIKLSIKKLKGAHLEKCKGTPHQNILYIIKNLNKDIIESKFKEYLEEYNKIKKENNEQSTLLDELGERPHQGKKNFNFEEVSKLTQEDILNNEDLNLIQKKTLLNIKKDISNQPININDYHKKIKVYYIYGPSGSGKTNKALDIIQENNYKNFDEVKYSNGFYIGASGLSKVCLYDEFRASHMSISEFINFIDYNKHNMNIKGGFIKNNYELIIITSIQDPNNIYNNVIDNEETREQILRRINIINLNK